LVKYKPTYLALSHSGAYLIKKFSERIPNGYLKVHSLMLAKEAARLCRQINYLNYSNGIVGERNFLKFLEKNHA
jgi:hypothetical protein